MIRPLPPDDLNWIVRAGHAPWEKLHSARVFLAGGTGFIGRWLTESLLHADQVLGLDLRLTLLSRNVAAARQRIWGSHRCNWIEGDVRTFSAPPERFDYIVHAATDSSQAGQSDPFGLVDQIVSGTQNMIALARRSVGARFLYVSSGAVYGLEEGSPRLVPETWAGCLDLTDPSLSYGHAKRLAEHLVYTAAARGLIDAVVARPFAFVGPGLPLTTHFAVGNFIDAALSHRPIRLQTDGRACRSYMYSSDLAVWLLVLMLSGESGSCFNVGSDEPLSLLELATLVRDLLFPEGEVLVGERPAVSRLHYVPDVARASSLGLKVFTPLRDAIVRTAEWNSPGPGPGLRAITQG